MVSLEFAACFLVPEWIVPVFFYLVLPGFHRVFEEFLLRHDFFGGRGTIVWNEAIKVKKKTKGKTRANHTKSRVVGGRTSEKKKQMNA